MSAKVTLPPFFSTFTVAGATPPKVERLRPKRAKRRYWIGEEIARGGMAVVHLGRLVTERGFSRAVAIKRMHVELAECARLRERFVNEARVAARVQHVNVVQPIDVIVTEGELSLVLEYVHGESLAGLLQRARAAGRRMPPGIVSAIALGMLRGLHAAHEARSEDGAPLEIVHRDISPGNVIVGADGLARVIDFGIATTAGRIRTAQCHGPTGKLSYMPPEQILRGRIDRRTDLFAAGVVLWEALAGERLFRRVDPVDTMDAVLYEHAGRLAERVGGLDPAIDALLERVLAKSSSDRFATADEMACALEVVIPPASAHAVARWVHQLAGDVLAAREQRVAAFERETFMEEDAAAALSTDRELDVPVLARSLEDSDVTCRPAAPPRAREAEEAEIPIEFVVSVEQSAPPRVDRRRHLRFCAIVSAVVLLMVGGVVCTNRHPNAVSRFRTLARTALAPQAVDAPMAPAPTTAPRREELNLFRELPVSTPAIGRPRPPPRVANRAAPTPDKSVVGHRAAPTSDKTVVAHRSATASDKTVVAHRSAPTTDKGAVF